MKIVFTFVYRNGYSSCASYTVTEKELNTFDVLYSAINQKMKNRNNEMMQDIINMIGADEGDILVSLNDIIEVKMWKGEV